MEGRLTRGIGGFELTPVFDEPSDDFGSTLFGGERQGAKARLSRCIEMTSIPDDLSDLIDLTLPDGAFEIEFWRRLRAGETKSQPDESQRSQSVP